MSECFLNKYSPKNINEFYVDNYSLLESPLKLNLLINGNNGSGKTSIIKHLINIYLNFHDDMYSNENVLFMNNLKDQGIQYCRNSVKLFCQTPSTYNSEDKIYKKIIAADDIDEFSDVSQQVISNYINKYSKNIIFLATCTNTLKVYDGLKSRMIIINTILPTYDNLTLLCKKVIENENIKLNQRHIHNIITSSNFSYKILLNTLCKIKIHNSYINNKSVDDENVDDETIDELITSINYNEFDKYIINIKNKNIQEALVIIFKIANSGISVIDILYEFTIYIKQKKEYLSDEDKYEIITLISKYITIFHDLHEDVIELGFLTNDLITKLS